MQVLRQHTKAVNDIDWSLDNTFLLSAGLEGSISMWMTATGQLLRIFLTASPACCAKFHLVNQSLVMAGTESGMVQVFNTGTGQLRHEFRRAKVVLSDGQTLHITCRYCNAMNKLAWREQACATHT